MKRRSFLAALLGAPVATIAAVAAVKASPFAFPGDRALPSPSAVSAVSVVTVGPGGWPSGQTYGVHSGGGGGGAGYLPGNGGAGGYPGTGSGYFGHGGDHH